MQIKKGSGIALLLAAVGMLSACGSGGDSNNPPVAEAQFITIDEDVVKDIVLSGVDGDGDVLSYKITTAPSKGSLNGTVPTLNYTPNANVNGEDTFEFSVSDGKAESKIAIVRITINPLNDIPIAETITANTKEEEAVTIELKGSDPDEGATLSYIVKANPSNGTLSGTMPNLLYTPSLDFNGIDTFSFVANDGGLESEAAIVSITVAAVNDLPVAESKSYAVNEDEPKTIIMGNDVDGDALTYTLMSGPSNGTLSGIPPNIVYTPNSNYIGADMLRYIVNDGIADSATTGTIDIVVYVANELVSNQAAAVVIGQTDFNGFAKNQDGTDTPGSNSINTSYGNPGVANGVLYLPDSKNNRILGFNSIPIADNEAADFLLGQVDFTSTTAAVSAVGFSNPKAVAFAAGKMFSAEYDSHRVLIWNSIPSINTDVANVVLGQDDFLSSASGGCTTTGLKNPEAVWAADGKLIVADSGNNRVLIWDSIPTSDNVQADTLLGQPDFVSCGIASPSAATLNYPTGVWTDGVRLVVLDSSNHRILIWNTFPANNFTSADIVLGQSDFKSNAINAGSGKPSAKTLNFPSNGFFSNGRQLYVPDTDNNRLLIWNEFPTLNFTPADVVLGQVDFDSSTSSPVNASSLKSPSGVYLNGSQLIVNDRGNNRYLIYNE